MILKYSNDIFFIRIYIFLTIQMIMIWILIMLSTK